MIEVLAGCALGIVTGLIPGLHLNMFLPLLMLSGSPVLLGLVIGITVSHSFFDFIPSMFLGVPDEATALAVLPAHRMVMRGNGLKAFKLSVFGGLYSALAAVLLLPLLFAIASLLPDIAIVVPILLVAVILFLILSSRRKLPTIIIFILSGTLGYLLLNSGFTPASTSLLAMLSGFFGTSMIINSLRLNAKVPPQKVVCNAPTSAKAILSGTLGGIFCGVMPALTSSVSGLLVRQFSGLRGDSEYITALGGINTTYALLSVVAIHLIGKPRSGAAIIISQLEPSLLHIVGLMLVALAVSSLLALLLSKSLIALFNRLNITHLNYFSLAFVCILAFIFGGPATIFVLVISTLLGLACISAGVRKSALMACLLIPVLIYYIA